MSSPLIAGVLLAAGRGSRFGGDKLRAPLPGEGLPLGVAAWRRLASVLATTVVVLRPGDHPLHRLFADAGASTTMAERADEGMGASLAAGVAAVRQADGFVVALADMPWIAVSTIEAVTAALRAGAMIAAPFHRGRRGHPVGFSSVLLDDLLALSGDEGARSILAAQRDAIVRIDVDDPGVLRDVDERGDLEG